MADRSSAVIWGLQTKQARELQNAANKGDVPAESTGPRQQAPYSLSGLFSNAYNSIGCGEPC